MCLDNGIKLFYYYKLIYLGCEVLDLLLGKRVDKSDLQYRILVSENFLDVLI